LLDMLGALHLAVLVDACPGSDGYVSWWDRQEGGAMTHHETPGAVVKVTELVGSSTQSFSDAVRRAVKAASRSIRNIRGVEVVSSTADVDENGELVLYKVNVKLAFMVEGTENL
jgi:flavin-binding protein dodecin